MPTTPGRRTARVPGLDELRLLTKVARLYHEKGVRQPQIAETLKLSQARVSRMLKQAESLGIVTTVITMPPGVHGDLEDQLQAHYGLRDVVVVDAEPAEVRTALGAATAAYLGITLTRGPVVGTRRGANRCWRLGMPLAQVVEQLCKHIVGPLNVEGRRFGCDVQHSQPFAKRARIPHV